MRLLIVVVIVCALAKVFFPVEELPYYRNIGELLVGYSLPIINEKEATYFAANYSKGILQQAERSFSYGWRVKVICHGKEWEVHIKSDSNLNNNTIIIKTIFTTEGIVKAHKIKRGKKFNR